MAWQRTRGAGSKSWPGNGGLRNVAGVNLGSWCKPQMLVGLRCPSVAQGRFGLDLSWKKKKSFALK